MCIAPCVCRCEYRYSDMKCLNFKQMNNVWIFCVVVVVVVCVEICVDVSHHVLI